MESDNRDQSVDELRRQRNREASARYRERNREKFNQRMRDWRAANREQDRLLKREWRNRIIATGSPDEIAAFRAQESEKTRRNQARNKDEVYNAYGGYKCNCCNESERMFLSIDHINNDGAAERKSGKYNRGGSSFYNWLRRNNFPEGYQVLCMNCQFGKHKNGGVCPHQKV